MQTCIQQLATNSEHPNMHKHSILFQRGVTSQQFALPYNIQCYSFESIIRYIASHFRASGCWEISEAMQCSRRDVSGRQLRNNCFLKIKHLLEYISIGYLAIYHMPHSDGHSLHKVELLKASATLSICCLYVYV